MRISYYQVVGAVMVLRPGTSEMSGSGGCLVISGWTRRRVTGGGRAVTGAVTETRTGAQTEIGVVIGT